MSKPCGYPVLSQCAKVRCQVFASITDQDLDLSKTKSEGVRGLKEFLPDGVLSL